MKYLNSEEVKLLVSRLKSLLGGRLLSVRLDSPIMVLEFLAEDRPQFLFFDMTAGCPVAILFEEKAPFKVKNNAKPISLFLKAHFVNKKLVSVNMTLEKGRIIYLQFEESCSLEVRLFPHGQNIIAIADKKSIALHKPKPIIENGRVETLVSYKVRSLEEIKKEWLEVLHSKNLKNKNLNKNVSRDKSEFVVEKLLSEIEKNQKAISEIQNQIKNLDLAPLTSPDEASPDERTGASRGELHERIKKLKQKIERLIDRKKQVELQAQIVGSVSKSLPSPNKLTHIKKKKIERNIKAKRWELPSGAMAVVGRSARENIELLRRAKPWDLWLHLKDYPGAYGFIYRNRNQAIGSEELKNVALWVVKMSLKNRVKAMTREKVDLVVTECRFLQLIKGDNLGRVQYKNSKTLRVQLP